MREMFQAKAPEAFEVLCKHLHATDPRVSVSAATQILDRAYGRPVQSIDVSSRMARRFAITPRCPRSVQRRRNGWKASGARMPGERWSPASLLPSMTSRRIRRSMGSHLTPPPIVRGKYRYLDGPCSGKHQARDAAASAVTGVAAPSMTSRLILEKNGSHLTPPPASIMGRYRYLDGPCSWKSIRRRTPSSAGHRRRCCRRYDRRLAESPISPAPHRSWEVPIPRRPLFIGIYAPRAARKVRNLRTGT